MKEFPVQPMEAATQAKLSCSRLRRGRLETSQSEARDNSTSKILLDGQKHTPGVCCAGSWGVPPPCIRVQRQLVPPTNINQSILTMFSEAKSKREIFHCSFQEPRRRAALALAGTESSSDLSLDKCGMTSGDSGDPEWLEYWATGCCTRSQSAKL